VIIGIGLDLCDVSRFADKGVCERFSRRWFSECEREYVKGRGCFTQTVAGIFAAKEAVLKAFGLPLFAVPMNEISVEHDEDGAPYIRLSGKALEVSRVRGSPDIYISITHEAGIAAAVCVLECR